MTWSLFWLIKFAALRRPGHVAQQAGFAAALLELLLGVPVVGLQLVQLVLRFGDGGLIESEYSAPSESSGSLYF